MRIKTELQRLAYWLVSSAGRYRRLLPIQGLLAQALAYETANKFGMLIQVPGSGLDLIERYQPVAVCVMDAQAGDIQAIREKSPTLVVFWKHEHGQHWAAVSPEWWAEEIWRQVEACPPDLVCYWNEPLGHDAAGDFADFDQRQARFIRRMRQLSGARVKVGAFCFAEGNFTKDGPVIPQHFPESTAEAEWVFINEYWKPHLYSPGMQGYHCSRWPFWLKWFEEAGRPDIQIGIKECGNTMAVNSPVHGGGPDVGWMSEEAKALGVTDQTYLDDLSQYNAYLCQEPRVIFALPFIWYPWPNQWGSFRHDHRPEIHSKIFAFSAPVPPEPEPEPNGGNEMDIKVFDLEHKERDFAYAKSKYGVAFGRAEVEPGQKVYRLVELWEKTGNTSLITQVLNEAGQPMANVDVAFYWPDAPDPPDPPTTVYDHDWYRKFKHGPTNKNGDVGPGMGPGAYHGEGEGGPHAVWVRDPNIPTDICEKLGMLAGTFHDHLDQKFQLMVAGGEPPELPPLPPGSAGEIVTMLRNKAQRMRQDAGELEAAADGLQEADSLAQQLADLL